MAETPDPLAGVPRRFRPVLHWGRPPHESVEFSVEIPEGASVSGVLAIERGRLLLKRLCVSAQLVHPQRDAASPIEEITSRTLRGVRVAEIVAQVRALIVYNSKFRLIDTTTGNEVAGWAESHVSLAPAADATTAAARPGRKGYPLEHYRRIARAYLDLVEAGMTRGIYDRLAAAESERTGYFIAPETVRGWVNKAASSELGLLIRGERGRAVAQPGPQLFIDQDGES